MVKQELKPAELKSLIRWGLEHLEELNIPSKLAVNTIKYVLNGATYKELFANDKTEKVQFKKDLNRLINFLEVQEKRQEKGLELAEFSSQPAQYSNLAKELIAKAIGKVSEPKPKLADKVYKTGAIREDKIGKGRFDYGEAKIYSGWRKAFEAYNSLYNIPKVLELALKQPVPVIELINKVVVKFINVAYKGEFETAILELSQYMEKCAENYPVKNWQKGLPNSSFYNSALRHYYKYMRGDDSEPHKSAFLWNCQGLIYNAGVLKQIENAKKRAKTKIVKPKKKEEKVG